MRPSPNPNQPPPLIGSAPLLYNPSPKNQLASVLTAGTNCPFNVQGSQKLITMAVKRFNKAGASEWHEALQKK